ncbi:MAG: two-component regulator propeller domain-containing protein [Acidobacteriota bacterium]
MPSLGWAERLPTKLYTTADGLPGNQINCIVPDSKGYLWFCTEEGLSRFDGYQFINYSRDEGLTYPEVRDFRENRRGNYWVATGGGGLYRFNPAAARRRQTVKFARPDTSNDLLFTPIRTADGARTGSANVLLEDSRGTTWCGTGHGLFRIVESGDRPHLEFVDIGLPREVEAGLIVRCLLEDPQGGLWVGTGSGLYRRFPNGRVEHYTTEHGLPANEVRSLLMTADRRLWAGTFKGLCQLVSKPQPGRPVTAHLYTERDGLYSANIRCLFETSDSRLLIGTTGALSEWNEGGRDLSNSPGRSRAFSNLLRDVHVAATAEDSDRNLWIGAANGVIKLVRGGLTTYTPEDGLGHAIIDSIFESRDGDLFVSSAVKELVISRFDGHRFLPIHPRLPHRLGYLGWGWSQLALQDSKGDWWLPTGEGLLRYPKVNRFEDLAQTPPKAVYTTLNGIPGNDIFRLYEDSHGDLWIVTFSTERNMITRWQRARNVFHTFSTQDGLPETLPIPLVIREDREGNVWIGFEERLLARFKGGRFQVFGEQTGLPEGDTTDIHCDRKGRLWLTTSRGGLSRVEAPASDHPRFVTYTTADGFSSNRLLCITEDLLGRLYVGTGKGVDRFSPQGNQVRHFTTADGLAGGDVRTAFCDGRGHLWFGSIQGLSRLIPEPDTPRRPPPILISGVRFAGSTYPLSALGAVEVGTIELGPGKNQVQIDFVSPNFVPGAQLHYQYFLEGADREWGPLHTLRSVNYASLRPGSYRFRVRAVNSDGAASPRPAIVSFVILRPIWQRWWFLTLVGFGFMALIYAAHHYRVARLRELDAVRMRIATDLHDDIGSNLSQIAILSEVAAQQVGGEIPAVLQPLSTIANTSRELVDSMGDIVWAINPSRDQLRDLTQRMRQFASNVFTARNISFRFTTPSEAENLKVGANMRRQVFLIFKETVHNMVRHSGCSEAEVMFAVRDNHLSLTLRDNGKGFVPDNAGSGHGLANMRLRAESLGGHLSVVSKSGQGTQVRLEVPLQRRHSFFSKNRYLPK